MTQEIFEQLPETAFKFVYIQAINPEYAENLVNRLSEADLGEELK